MPSRLRRGPRERALAWLLTGPLGHLWSVAAEVALAWGRWALARVRGRAP